MARTYPSPRCQVARGGEHAHVAAGRVDDHVSSRDPDPGDGRDQVPGRTKREHRLLDPIGEDVDGGGVLVDELAVQIDQERLVIGEPADQRLPQRGDLGPRLPDRTDWSASTRSRRMSAVIVDQVVTSSVARTLPGGRIRTQASASADSSHLTRAATRPRILG